MAGTSNNFGQRVIQQSMAPYHGSQSWLPVRIKAIQLLQCPRAPVAKEPMPAGRVALEMRWHRRMQVVSPHCILAADTAAQCWSQEARSGACMRQSICDEDLPRTARHVCFEQCSLARPSELAPGTLGARDQTAYLRDGRQDSILSAS